MCDRHMRCGEAVLLHFVKAKCRRGRPQPEVREALALFTLDAAQIAGNRAVNDAWMPRCGWRLLRSGVCNDVSKAHFSVAFRPPKWAPSPATPSSEQEVLRTTSYLPFESTLQQQGTAEAHPQNAAIRRFSCLLDRDVSYQP